MPLSDHSGKNSFNLNNKSFTNRGASGGTPIYDIATSGGTSGGTSGAGLTARAYGTVYMRNDIVVTNSYNISGVVLHQSGTNAGSTIVVTFENEITDPQGVLYSPYGIHSSLQSLTTTQVTFLFSQSMSQFGGIYFQVF
jgi:hypothetical protein